MGIPATVTAMVAERVLPVWAVQDTAIAPVLAPEVLLREIQSAVSVSSQVLLEVMAKVWLPPVEVKLSAVGETERVGVVPSWVTVTVTGVALVPVMVMVALREVKLVFGL